jgi:hypothetical protein
MYHVQFFNTHAEIRKDMTGTVGSGTLIEQFPHPYTDQPIPPEGISGTRLETEVKWANSIVAVCSALNRVKWNES